MMSRTLLRVPLGFLADSLCNYSKYPFEKVLKTVTIRGLTTLGVADFRPRYGAGSINRYLQVQIVDSLRSGQRQRASDLLSHLSCCQEFSTADDFVYLLDYCSKVPDALFVMEICRLMKEKKITINKKICIFLVRALTKSGYLEEACNWLTFLGDNGRMKPSLPIYNIFLNGCVKMQNPVLAGYCLQLMEIRSIGKSEVTYCELLKLAVWQRNLSAVKEIWVECTKYYSPSITTLQKFVWSFSKLWDIGSAFVILQQMVAQLFRANDSAVRSVDGRFHSSRLDIPIPSCVHKLHSKSGSVNNDELEDRFMDAREDTALISNCNYESSGPGLGQNLSSRSHLMDLGVIPIEPRFFPSTIFENGVSPINYRESFGGSNPLITSASGFCGQHMVAAHDKYTDFEELSRQMEVGANDMQDEISTLSMRKILTVSFSDVIHGCAHTQNCELAEKLFLQMLQLGLEPSLQTYNGFLKAVINERGVIPGMKVVKAMEKRNLEPNTATLLTLAEGFSKNLDLDLAEVMLDKIVQIPPNRIRPFNTLLTACDVMDEPERGIRVLAKMKKLNIKSDIRTYELLFSLFGNVNAPYEEGNLLSRADVWRRIRTVEADMVKNGVHHSPRSMHNLLRALGDEGMLQEMIKYLQVAENNFHHVDPYQITLMYNTVLHSLVEINEWNMAIKIFGRMKSLDLPSDGATYDIMIDCCSRTNCFTSACILVARMIQDGFLLQTCTYTTLIKIVLDMEGFDDALNLLYQASLEGVVLDVLLFNTILDTASWKRRFDIIEFIIEYMHRERVQPDPTTCYYVFIAYMKQNYIKTAMEALQVLSIRMISEDETIQREKIASFENLILADEDPEAEKCIVQLFKDSEEHLAAALLNLRWCAISGASISWLPSQSPWARRLSKP
ncbi:pentatricopeptide repeat-containing protein At1g76280 isoform X1 [Amborella trichopoda]|uniref:pentatricopeptide repeat-containing protein At1g76280 isoform X1 n=1 Tax=Amborella trichopoda TaxID=13333 RepID=UPI0005D430EA|nr:pentatricopeptide repeat-containing protein At1g76280 isoform X1 [Amborella trichopoda]|eukprot:XP_011623262.1 pentatricopeptide repeat-containing protein At1g76280 isoform X1 [Amborella trichopoda]